MEIQEVVADVKGRLESIGGQAQDVAKTSVAVLKEANGVVVGNVQNLAKTEVEAARDLYEVAVASVNKARDAGVKEVANDPISFLPEEGKERVVSAYNDTIDVLAKTASELGKVLKKGADSIGVELGLIEKKKAAPKTAARKASSTAKKATTTAKKATTRKTTTKKAAA